MSTRNHSLEAKLKHSRKQLYQRTKPMKSKHGQHTAAAATNTQAAEAKVILKRLFGASIAVSDWLAGGCDIHDIPRPEIALLAAFTREASSRLKSNPKDGN